MPIYFLNCLAAVNCHIQMGLWKATCVSKSNSYSLHLLCAGDGWVWRLTSSFSVVVDLVSAASVCTGEGFLPFWDMECKLCTHAVLSVSPFMLQSSGTLLTPVQAPLGNLAPLRGLAASPAGILRRSLNLDVGSSVDSSLVAKVGTQVRFCLLWEHALASTLCKRSQAWWYLKT